MTADIINLDTHRMPPNPGNGAREAMAAALSYCMEPMGDVLTDDMLAGLWLLGFKVVPLEEKDLR